MKVKIPNLVCLGAHSYEVKFKPNLRIDDGFTACLNFRTNKLWVDPVESPTQRGVSFIHEVVEMLNNQYEMGLAHDNIMRLGEGLAEFMLKNLNIEFDWSDIKEE